MHVARNNDIEIVHLVLFFSQIYLFQHIPIFLYSPVTCRTVS